MSNAALKSIECIHSDCNDCSVWAIVSLTTSVASTVVSLCVPLYWLGEVGRITRGLSRRQESRRGIWRHYWAGSEFCRLRAFGLSVFWYANYHTLFLFVCNVLSHVHVIYNFKELTFDPLPRLLMNVLTDTVASWGFVWFPFRIRFSHFIYRYGCVYRVVHFWC